MNLIAIRHGETQWNVMGREMGQLDSPLTKRGIAQAEAIARRLKGETFDSLYCSDLGRAVQTAEFITAATGVAAETHKGLRERHMGIFQGLTKPEIAERFPSEYSDYRRIGHTYQIPDGESGQQRLERSVRVLSEIGQEHPNQTVVVITHGGFLMGFFEHVLGLQPGGGWRFKRQNAGYSRFEYEVDRWSLVTWNDTSHLVGISALDDPTVQVGTA